MEGKQKTFLLPLERMQRTLFEMNDLDTPEFCFPFIVETSSEEGEKGGGITKSDNQNHHLQIELNIWYCIDSPC